MYSMTYLRPRERSVGRANRFRWPTLGLPVGFCRANREMTGCPVVHEIDRLGYDLFTHTSTRNSHSLPPTRKHSHQPPIHSPTHTHTKACGSVSAPNPVPFHPEHARPYPFRRRPMSASNPFRWISRGSREDADGEEAERQRWQVNYRSHTPCSAPRPQPSHQPTYRS